MCCPHLNLTAPLAPTPTPAPAAALHLLPLPPSHRPPCPNPNLPPPPLPQPAALDRGIAAYKGKPEEWAALRGRIMADASRWSWDVAAGSYVDLYTKVLSI